NAFSEKIEKQELENLQAAAKAGSEFKLQVNAGHGINYANIALIHKVPHLTELNIGHSIISRAVFVGIEDAIKELLGAMADYKGWACSELASIWWNARASSVRSIASARNFCGAFLPKA